MLDELPIHPTLTHPRTGEPIRAIWVSPTGRVFWPIMGGDGTGDGGGGEGGTGGEGGSGGGTGSGEGGTGGAGGAGGEGADKTFSQADVDRLISERLNREKAKYSDYDALKDKASKSDKAPEIEKIRNAAIEEGRTSATEAANAKLINFAARAQLAEAKAVNPATAVKTLDVSAVKVDKDGNVDEDALKAAIEALKKSDPYLFGNASGSASDAGIGAGGGNGGQRAASLADAISNKLAANAKK